ncbi:Uncharacterised protein [Legionella beliardensis]|uniref:Uncharacterized protein n=1 Tax=Legionella beliardensis TaxID=91822 RepID=A0A378I230_9GAMM|nr:hypothetical protein [Legionella beliardensis]STX29247.1 Uncharacterised protein [Legionella beliardensis]
MKGIMLLPLVSSLTACGYMGVSDYTTVYPTTAGCCNSVVVNNPCCKRVVVKPVVVKPIVKRSCCSTKIVRPVATPCCSSYVQTTPVYDTMTVVNTEPVDITTVSYDYY